MGRRRIALPALAVAMALMWLLHAGPAQAAPAADVAADPALEARVDAVAAELRCLVCQNQTLADSHAPLAIDLKNQVREQLAAGRDARQVIDYMTERYGDFVRYRPPLKATTLLLWGGPLVLLAFGGVLIGQGWARHRRDAPAEPGLSAAEAAVALALLSSEQAPPHGARAEQAHNRAATK